MTTRISNLGPSGLDIDATVKGLMTARRVPLDKMFQDKTLLEWKKASYNTMYKTISDFRTTVFNNKLQATLSPKSALSGNSSVATVTASPDASDISHDLVVTALAAGVKKTSSAPITPTGNAKDSLASQFGISGTFDFNITNGSMTKTITVDSSKSIYELVSSINSSGANVAASYDATLDRVFLSTKGTGAATGISFSDSGTYGTAGTDFLKNNLKLDTTAAVGHDAAFSLDGVSLTEASNDFTISGVSYSLKSVGGSDANPVKVAVSPDVDTTVANVKAFVDSYNAMLAKVNAALAEPKNKDYLPLTDDQKSTMKDADITTWTAKAQSGMLNNDPILRSLVDGVRNNVSSPVSGVSGNYNSMSSLGISTASYTEGGKLYVDETKLRAALTADPDAVSKVFGSTGTTSNSQGIAVRMYDTLKTAMDKIVTQGGVSPTVSDDTQSIIAKKIKTYTTDMTDLTARLKDIEDRYYAQFDAMDVALTKIQQQSSWLQSQFGTNSSSGSSG